MMLGTRAPFTYAECSNCGSLQLVNPPEDYTPYYTGSYYSQSAAVEPLFHPPWKGRLKGLRDRWALTGRGFWPALVAAALPKADVALYGYRRLGLQPHHRLLDVGCGNGKLTYTLYNAGFRGVSGIEPFLSQPITYHNGLQIQKQHILQHEPAGYDAILFNHSFEHLPNPQEAMAWAKCKLVPGGKVLLRLPTVSSWAWQHYRTHWVQLDAPRHICIPSVKGLQAMAALQGFIIESIRQEGTAFQITGSEQYRMDIPLYGDERSWFEGNAQLFTSAQIKDFEKKAKQLNQQKLGDAISVVLMQT